jgi:Icc-related predicted phosphoesterase
MKIQILSDLHTEFLLDNGKALIKALESDVDVLVVAGDLSVNIVKNRKNLLSNAIKLLTKAFKHVVYVAGNHEYYHSSKPKTHTILRNAVKRHENFHWLNNSFVEINGQRFIGGTLWFEKLPDSILYTANMTDFNVIKKFEDFVYLDNYHTRSYLERKIEKDDIVITHHMPAWKSVPPRYTNSELNRFFVCDVEYIILDRQPKVWVHGHTHSSCDYMINKTRVICNPFGYSFREENADFVDKLIL